MGRMKRVVDRQIVSEPPRAIGVNQRFVVGGQFGSKSGFDLRPLLRCPCIDRRQDRGGGAISRSCSNDIVSPLRSVSDLNVQ